MVVCMCGVAADVLMHSRVSFQAPRRWLHSGRWIMPFWLLSEEEGRQSHQWCCFCVSCSNVVTQQFITSDLTPQDASVVKAVFSILLVSINLSHLHSCCSGSCIDSHWTWICIPDHCNRGWTTWSCGVQCFFTPAWEVSKNVSVNYLQNRGFIYIL